LGAELGFYPAGSLDISGRKNLKFPELWWQLGLHYKLLDLFEDNSVPDLEDVLKKSPGLSKQQYSEAASWTSRSTTSDAYWLRSW
jgi:hypothetical protein